MATVRTDYGALVTGAVIFGAFAIACARQGFGITDPDLSTSDRRAMMGVAMATAYVAAFGIAHTCFQKFGLTNRGLYSLAGAVAAVGAFLVSMENAAIAAMMRGGTLAISMTVPAALGALTGFIYHHRAGYAADGDDPHALAAVLEGRAATTFDGTGRAAQRYRRAGIGAPAAIPQSFVSPDQAHAGVAGVEYFSGPFQVRTSYGSMLVAAIGGTMLYNFGVLFMMIMGSLQPRKPLVLTDNGLIDTSKNSMGDVIAQQFLTPSNSSLDLGLPPFIEGYAEGVLSAAGGGLILAAITAIPFAAVIFACHMIARARDKTDYVSYALTGFIAPPILGFLLFFVFFFVGLKMAFPCAIAMIIYRKFAGLEPKMVHEDIEVSDWRGLVGADHARRKYGRVIMK